jgi:hypothetical protein
MPDRAGTINEAINSSLSTRGLLTDDPMNSRPALSTKTVAGTVIRRQYASFVKKIGGKETGDHVAAIRRMVRPLTHQEGH